jgi:hypothetical protein
MLRTSCFVVDCWLQCRQQGVWILFPTSKDELPCNILPHHVDKGCLDHFPKQQGCTTLYYTSPSLIQ